MTTFHTQSDADGIFESLRDPLLILAAQLPFKVTRCASCLSSTFIPAETTPDNSSMNPEAGHGACVTPV